MTNQTVPLTSPADLQIDIGTLSPHPRNARRGDVAAIADSLRRHGQYRPIVVNRRTMQVLAGNHTMQAAASLGWQQIAATFVDVDDDEALRILLIDNKLNDDAGYEDSTLAALLRELAITDDGLDGTGFSGEELDDLLRKLEPPGAGDGGIVDFDERYEVVIECDDERAQHALLTRLSDEGLRVRALIV